MLRVGGHTGTCCFLHLPMEAFPGQSRQPAPAEGAPGDTAGHVKGKDQAGGE